MYFPVGAIYRPLIVRENPGRIAQRESVPFTRERSKVRSLVRPPLSSHIQLLSGSIPLKRAPKKPGHNRGTLIRHGCQKSLRYRPPLPPHRPDANEETSLIHYDDIRVGSIVMRQGPMEPEGSLLFDVASRLPRGSPSHLMPPAASIHCGNGYASWHSKRERRPFRIACVDIASIGGCGGSQQDSCD